MDNTPKDKSTNQCAVCSASTIEDNIMIYCPDCGFNIIKKDDKKPNDKSC